jgi:orotate phosphoribosyltransferase-like protein
MLYTVIKHKIKDVKEFTKMGLINPNWLRDLEVFEQYAVYVEEGKSKQEAYKQAGTDFNISWQSVKVIVRKMVS